MKTLMLITLFAFLSACIAPQFTVRKNDSRFEAEGYYSEGNRISTTSITGGTHIDDYGVFINPFIDTKGSRVGFFITNKTRTSSNFGSPNSLGAITAITFLTDKGEVRLNTRTNANQYGSGFSNTMAHDSTLTFNESAFTYLTAEQYKKISNSKSLVVHISGSKRNMTYEPDQIQPSFQENIKNFYEKYVIKRLLI